MPAWRRSEGQATVELVAVLPALVAVCALVWQLALAGHAVWAASAAARAAARAHAVGGDGRAVARERLPEELAAAARVVTGTRGEVAVTVRIPAVLGIVRLGTTTAHAHFEPQR